MSYYPSGTAARDHYVLDRRPSRPSHDPWRAHNVLVEDEPAADGTTARVATVFLTGRECPWRCLMCDLWQYTTTGDTPEGAIATQVRDARALVDRDHRGVTQMKLYNAGSFFDPRAVPETDYAAVAAATSGLSRVIVESHPSLVGRRTAQLLDTLKQHAGDRMPVPALEVAMGLETAHELALDRLNKHMTLDDFADAADRLVDLDVALRVFLLVSPPFIPREDQDEWLQRSVTFAFQCGAGVVSLIPTRPGNGALDAVAAEGAFEPPALADLERSLAIALALPCPTGARVLADTWDLERFATCVHCLSARRERLQTMNLAQTVEPPVSCAHCDSTSIS